MTNSGTIDDSKTVTHDKIDEIVRTLCVSYSHVRRSFQSNQTRIKTALNNGDVNQSILLIAVCYRLPRGFLKRIGYSANISAAAALQTEVECVSKRPVSSTVYFQLSKIELCKMPHYRLLHIIAHELAHARMGIDGHKLRQSEFATDVLALLVTGSSKGYNESMRSRYVQYGYIRPELLDELYRCLAKYSEVMYLK